MGTVFKITPGGMLATLHSFEFTDGYNVWAGLVQATDGNFYGTTFWGGANNYGTVYKITPGGLGLFRTVEKSSRCFSQRLKPHTRGRKGGIVRELSSWKTICVVFVIYAATAIASPAQTLTTLTNFDGFDGGGPEALVQATDGNFYGTTIAGGNASQNCQYGCGTVFKITPEGTLTTLYIFCTQTNCPDGAKPGIGLVQATDGNFYGTTFYGGTSSACPGGCGTVFKITPAGTLTTLHSFDITDGAFPFVGPVQATDGNFYGTTTQGGTKGSGHCDSLYYGCGTVFKITPSGTLTTLHSFDGTDGYYIFAGLVQATDGNFYGTTEYGGAYGPGTVFKITPEGTQTTLHSFDNTDGANSYAGLVQAIDGNFYGTTWLAACGASS